MASFSRKITWQWDRIKWIFKNFRSINRYMLLVNMNHTHNSATPTYSSDGLIVFNSRHCLDEPAFERAYLKSLQVNDWRTKYGTEFDMRWRYYIVCYFAEMVKKLDGDFVECGVYKGGYAMALMEYLNFPSLKKKYWMLDTFEGLSYDHLTENEKASGLFEKYSEYDDCYEWVQKFFKNLPAEIIKGTVPETLTQCTAEKICYLSIDMNCAGPEIAAANHFWDKLVTGAVIILDDYGFIGHEEQQAAFDAFAKEKNVRILQLPTGQGIIFKP